MSPTTRVAGVLGALCLVSVGSACSAGHHTEPAGPAGSHGAASITIDHHQRALDVTSCTREAHAVHVVAQAAGGWTLDLRTDRTNHNAMLVLVHNGASGVQSYQASANVLHPHGNPPSRIEVTRDGTQLSGSAKLLRSAGVAGKTDAAKHKGRPATTPAAFRVACADITSVA